MGNINICGRKDCGGCPDVVTNKAGEEVILTENGAVMKLTFEQVSLIYKQMCVNRSKHICTCGDKKCKTHTT